MAEPDTGAMSRVSYILKRGGTYYFRIRVPADVAHAYPRTEIKRSLRTKDLSDAKRRAAAMHAEVQDEFARLRQADNSSPIGTEPRHLTKITDADAANIAATYSRLALGADDDARLERASGAPVQSETEYLETVAGYRKALNHLKRAYALGDVSAARTSRDTILLLSGITLDHNLSDEELAKLDMSLLKAFIDTNKALIARAEGETITTDSLAPLERTLHHATVHRDAKKTYEDILEKWGQFQERPQKTKDDYGAAWRSFREFISDKPLAELTRRDIRDFRDNQLTKGSARTAQKRVGQIHTLLAVAAEYELIPANPAAGVHVKLEKNTPAPRVEFSEEDLRTIFSSELYVGVKKWRGGKGPAAKWIPLIGLYSGARVEETAQLRIGDIVEVSGIPVMRITTLDDEGKPVTGRTLKTASSEREVPIHPELVRLGLLRYRDSLKGGSQDWLFPDLVPDIYGKRSGNWVKWFSNHLRRRMGIRDKRKTLHSFRHTFKTYARGVVPKDIQDALTGHAAKDVAERYGSTLLNVKRDHLIRIPLPDINLDPVFPEQVTPKAKNFRRRRPQP
jgi:integrase